MKKEPFAGVTAKQIKAQFAKNAKQLGAMADKAKETGRKVNGYTEAQLRTMAANAAAKAK